MPDGNWQCRIGWHDDVKAPPREHEVRVGDQSTIFVDNPWVCLRCERIRMSLYLTKRVARCKREMRADQIVEDSLAQ
jgi:hypothetical protein